MEFKKYARKGLAEMHTYNPKNMYEKSFMNSMSISDVDRQNGSPKLGDMIARNPNNHNDVWLVSEKYFKENFLEDISQVSDGYHTFDELYFHRMFLFSIICNQNKEKFWKTRLHSDGSMYENYFLVGCITSKGLFSYHFHLKYWSRFHCDIVLKAPVHDGHTSNDIVRLRDLIQVDINEEPKP